MATRIVKLVRKVEPAQEGNHPPPPPAPSSALPAYPPAHPPPARRSRQRRSRERRREGRENMVRSSWSKREVSRRMYPWHSCPVPNLQDTEIIHRHGEI